MMMFVSCFFRLFLSQGYLARGALDEILGVLLPALGAERHDLLLFLSWGQGL